MALLFDASALVNLILRRGSKALRLAKDNFALDLTGYEVGNALWRLCLLQRKITPEEASLLLGATTGFLGRLREIFFVDLDAARVLSMAISNRISFYDAAYVVAAEVRGLRLVTDDEHLRKLARQWISTQDTAGLD